MAKIIPFRRRSRLRRLPRMGRLPTVPTVLLGGTAAIAAMAALFVFWWEHSAPTDVALAPIINVIRGTASRANQIAPSEIRVIDGDTIRARGDLYRLIGFNTPESGDRAQCVTEHTLSDRATARLIQIVAAGQLELERRPCACPPGTEGTKRCNFGRLCGTLTAGGTDVGSILIAEGLAQRYVCGSTSCPPRQSWCGHRT